MGSITLTELLHQADNDEVVGKMKVLSVLESLPGLGKVKARRLMDGGRDQRNPPPARPGRSAAQEAVREAERLTARCPPAGPAPRRHSDGP